MSRHSFLRQLGSLCVLLLVLNCNHYDPINSKSVISAVNNTDSVTFNHCHITYQVEAATIVDLSIRKAAFKKALTFYNTTNRQMSIDTIKGSDKADLRFVFTDSPPQPFLQKQIGLGLVIPSISGLTRLVRETNGTVSLYLSASNSWNIEVLAHAIGYLTGRALGLPESSETVSFLNPIHIENQSAILTDSDVKWYKTHYNEPCWFQLKNLPFDANKIDTSYSLSGYVFLDGSDASGSNPGGLNQFWVYDKDNDVWNNRASLPLQRDPQYVLNKLAFIINDTIYAGAGFSNRQWFPKTAGNFYRYDLSTHLWVMLPNKLPQIGLGSGHSFTLNKKGFIVSYQVDNFQSPYYVVYRFDPSSQTWASDYSIRSAQKAYYELGNTFVFIINEKAYLICANSKIGLNYLFDPLLVKEPWHPIETLFNTSSKSSTGFTINNDSYAFVETQFDGTKVWRYQQNTGFRSLTYLFPGHGHLKFSFVLGNRAYIGTSTNELWVYTP